MLSRHEEIEHIQLSEAYTEDDIFWENLGFKLIIYMYLFS